VDCNQSAMAGFAAALQLTASRRTAHFSNDY